MTGELLREAYPLTWPDHQPRMQPHQRRTARFEWGFARSRNDLLNELRLLGAQQVLLSTNIPLRRAEVDLCDACGSDVLPTCTQIWARISRGKGGGE